MRGCGGEGVSSSFEPLEQGEPALANVMVGMAFERCAEVALGTWAGGDLDVRVERVGERLDAPRLEVNDTFALERAGPAALLGKSTR